MACSLSPLFPNLRHEWGILTCFWRKNTWGKQALWHGAGKTLSPLSLSLLLLPSLLHHMPRRLPCARCAGFDTEGTTRSTFLLRARVRAHCLPSAASVPRRDSGLTLDVGSHRLVGDDSAFPVVYYFCCYRTRPPVGGLSLPTPTTTTPMPSTNGRGGLLPYGRAG